MDYQNDFVVPIMRGEADEYLSKMIETIKMRKSDIQPKIWEFQVGDRVSLINTSPKYLNGAKATIKKVNRTKVVIDLDNKAGRFHTNISTPLSMIEKV
jgi:hypothetical protein